MTVLLLIYTGLLTLFIVERIHHYEAIVRDLEDSISDYKRAINLSKNSDHYTHLQLDNKKLKKQILELSYENDTLMHQNKKLKKDNQELLNGILPQYESSTYKSSTWDVHYAQDEIDFEQ